MSSISPPPYDVHQFPEKLSAEADLKAHFGINKPESIRQVASPQTLAWHGGCGRKVKVFLSPQNITGSSVDKKTNDPPEGAKPVYSLHIGCKDIELYSGDITTKSASADSAKLLIEVDGEGFFNTLSTYYDVDASTRRSVQMYRATKDMGIEPDGFLSKRRTFEDFEGNKYKWSTSCGGGDHKCVRLSDGAIIASFKRTKFSFWRYGDFTLHQTVPEKTLQLLLATCAMCYELQRRRRRQAPAAAAAGHG